MKYDVIIIGAGPGGYTGAIQAAKLGLKTALIEKEKVGGTCLNWGCIPTKTYYKNAEFLKEIKSSEEYGVQIDNFTFSMEKAYLRKEEVVGKLTAGIVQLLKGNKIDVYKGEGSFVDKNTVKISGEEEVEIQGKNIIIASGSKTNVPPIKGIEVEGVLDSKSILELQKVPESLVIIGAGVIGIEFAGIFNYFGSQVQVLEFMPDILLNEDREVVKRFLPLLKKQGVKVNTSTKVIEITKTDNGFLVKAENKKGQLEEFTATYVLNATGRLSATEGLGIENVGLNKEKGFIKVDKFYQTEVPGIYAIGDVNGIIQLAHAASHQGIRAVEHIVNPGKEKNESLIPSCTFTFPEISSIGLTEEKAKEEGMTFKTNKFLFMANGKALAIGEKDGFVKVITDENNKLIGVHILGPHASDLIHEAAVAMSKGLGVEDIAQVVHAHPTLAEAFDEAVLGINGTGIHQI